MEESFRFLSWEGLDEGQVQEIQALIHPSNFSSDIEFPWSASYANENMYSKANLSSLNVHAPAFEAYVSACQNHTPEVVPPQPHNPMTVPYSNGSNVPLISDPRYYTPTPAHVRTITPIQQNYTNGQPLLHNNVFDQNVTYSQPPKPFSGDYYATSQTNAVKVSAFKLNPTVSSFVPSKPQAFLHPELPANGVKKQAEGFATADVYRSNMKESYAGEGQFKEGQEGYIVKGSMSDVIKSNIIKYNESSLMKVNEKTVIKTNESSVVRGNENTVMISNESNVMKVDDTNAIRVNENKVVKSNEGAVMKVDENIEMKVDEIRKVSENSVMKISENKVVKPNESAAVNVNESNAMKVNESNVMKVKGSRNEEHVVRGNRSELARRNDKFVQEQNSSIENFAEEVSWNGVKQGLEHDKIDPVKEESVDIIQETQQSVKPARRSWADIVSKGQKPAEKVSLSKPAVGSEKSGKMVGKDQESEELSIAEDNMALQLGLHLFNSELNFQPVLLQPRGLINRRNWCYINATLQALLACPPFYTLLRNLPLGPGVEREKSSTPVIDSMVKVAYEFLQNDKPQEELQVGQPFQPDFIYDMLRDLKSDCLKGQQEDAEEFLSFILNGMHEEMVKIIKHYEKKNHIDIENEPKENGGMSEGEEEWQVIGSKHKGMVTRKVAEHKTPISDLLGGQIKSFLTTSGNKTSASIQPFFTLQLDVQSENVTSVSEALKEMTIKEPIQGYTCAKTKQEVEAFSHIALQKLPPVLILHLKRFVYNKNGGCKKVMKKTDYPIMLEINKDMFSPDVKKYQRLRQYRLFAVMYHDGEEAVKGHYISDVYNHGSQTWIRCDDRAVTAVTEEQVLSYSPPRVPYLLFYQES